MHINHQRQSPIWALWNYTQQWGAALGQPLSSQIRLSSVACFLISSSSQQAAPSVSPAESAESFMTIHLLHFTSVGSRILHHHYLSAINEHPFIQQLHPAKSDFVPGITNKRHRHKAYRQNSYCCLSGQLDRTIHHLSFRSVDSQCRLVRFLDVTGCDLWYYTH